MIVSDDVYEFISKLEKKESFDEILRTIYQWVKCDYINFRQFKELILYYKDFNKKT